MNLSLNVSHLQHVTYKLIRIPYSITTNKFYSMFLPVNYYYTHTYWSVTTIDAQELQPL